ncbi:MAG: AAA family ATPase, partial [Bacteroidota bacterium]
MKVKEIHIKNYRGIKDISFKLKNNLNVFVGINGSGKTTVLDAIATSFSWLINRINRQNATGTTIPDDDIRNDAPFSSIGIFVADKEKDYKWKIIRAS